MKKLLIFSCLLVAMTASMPIHAAELTVAAPPASPADMIKDIPIYPRPETFEDAQKMALQNRQERLVLLQNVINCIQQATTIDDISRCQADEAKDIATIRLSYCDTDMSWGSMRKIRNQKNAKPADTVANAVAGGAPPPPRSTECQKAIEFLTGKKSAQPSGTEPKETNE